MRPTPLTARTRLAAILFTAGTLLLAACSSTPPLTPAITVDLDTAAADLIRGDTRSFVVTITRVDGAADPVELSLTGLPANVSASLSPSTLGAVETQSTLTITAASDATETTADVTVTGTSGALIDQATLSLEVVSLTINGRLGSALGRSLIGATVSSQGATDFSDVEGSFTLDGLSLPYDVIVSAASGNGVVHVYEALTTASPVLAPIIEPVATTGDRTAAIEGTVLGGAAVAVDHVVRICVEGLTRIVYGCTTATATEIEYVLNANWFDEADVSVRLHALHLEVDGDNNPVAYLGYDLIAMNLDDGAPTTADLSFAAVGGITVQGTLSPDPGLSVDAGVVFARFGTNLAMPVAQIASAAVDFDVLMPAAAGITYDVLGVSQDATGFTLAWKRGTSAADLGDLALEDRPQPVTPADSAVGVDLTTPFIVADGGGARTFGWNPNTGGPEVYLTTERTEVTMPDPALGGFAFPADTGANWIAFGHGGAAIDAAAGDGVLPYYDLLNAPGNGGPGVGPDGSFTIGALRSFTFTP